MMNRDRGNGLIALMPSPEDLEIAKIHHWYRIPVSQVKRNLKQRWPPAWLAFYLPKAFGGDAFHVRYWADVAGIYQVGRRDLFPNEQHPKKANKQYYKIKLSSLKRLSKPIPSKRYRRLVFIPTTWQKLMMADEINDLWDDSPLEDDLWSALKRLAIPAERQHVEKADGTFYILDFAIYCSEGKIDVETDGDSWHITKASSKADNIRDNALETKGWRTLRFTTQQVREEMETYCIPKIAENINHLGGVNTEDKHIPRMLNLQGNMDMEQLTLF